MGTLCVPARKITLETRQLADRSVPSVLTVHKTKPVLIRNVQIPVREHAELMPGVKSSVTTRFAAALLLILVTLLLDACSKRVRLLSSFLSYFFKTSFLCLFLMHGNENFLVEKPQLIPSGNPCVPSPCGPNAQCRSVGGTPACSCLPNYIGRPPNCRPECSINEECPGNLACQNERCRDPCPGSCGVHASCVVVKHAPMCTCDPGFTGDPFSGCSPIPSKTTKLLDYFMF